jgi:maltose/moltooligosaccharide transporter
MLAEDSKIVKPSMSFWSIINMNIGFFGIQYSFGLQQSAVTPIYDFLGAKPDQIPWLHLAGPVTGLVVQPIIGALSDKTWSPKWGRRKPYFFVGAMLCSICLLAFPFSSSLWMAAGLLWILDAGNNTAMEPYRAFVADRLPKEQHSTGFLSQSFFTGFGQTLANLSLYIFPLIIAGKTGKIPNWVFASFILGSICSIGSIWWSMRTTKELPPSQEELLHMKSSKLNVLTPFKDVFNAIVDMPKVMWMLALVYLFQWYALFCYWQNSSKSVALSSFGWQMKTDKQNAVQQKMDIATEAIKNVSEKENVDINNIFTKDVPWKTAYNNWVAKIPDSLTLSNTELNEVNTIQENNKKYEEAVSFTGSVNAWYNVVTFLVAFGLVALAKRIGAKWVHSLCVLVAGIGFIAFPFIQEKWLLYVAITGFGIGWASMMGIPYLMVVNDIPKERYGVYMGIINMMIVIPMFIQTLTFGPILKHVFNNDSGKAIMFAGVLLIIAAALTLLVKGNEPKKSKEYLF